MKIETVKGIKAALKEIMTAAEQLKSDNGMEVINCLVYMYYAVPLVLTDIAKADDDVAQTIEALRGFLAEKQIEIMG